MKSIQSLFTVMAVSVCVAVADAYSGQYFSLATEMYFEQPISHTNYIDNYMWKQRLFLTDTYFKKGGPLFFYSGNEGPIESFMDNSGFVFTLAQEFDALVVFAEHRYYGKSLPFGGASYTKNNIKYLSAEQALADYAVLVSQLKQEYNISKVISFGGSYGGMLSAWFRFKYPNVVDGALAASAPIYIVADLVSRTAFFEKVTQDFAKADARCPTYVREAFVLIGELAEMGDAGLKALTEAFSLCLPLESSRVAHLEGWVRNSFTQLAMVDYPYPADFLAPLPANPVSYACNLLINASDRVSGLAQAAGLFYNGTNGQLPCFDIETLFIECADPTGCGTGPAASSWDYQACTEMSLSCDTNNVTDMFPPTTFDPSDYCQKTYGVTRRRGWMETQFWGKDIMASSNIIFSNGDLDPWSVGGVLENVSDSLTAIMIDGGAHHLDLRAANPKDPPAVTAARKQERDIIAKWIQ